MSDVEAVSSFAEGLQSLTIARTLNERYRLRVLKMSVTGRNSSPHRYNPVSFHAQDHRRYFQKELHA